MAGTGAGITAGILAGAAGATALNATTYLDQLVRGSASTSSPAGGAPGAAAGKIAGRAGVDVAGAGKRGALGALGGLGIGVAVAAIAGALRGVSTTPPRPVAAAILGLAAMGLGDGLALATRTAAPDWNKPSVLVRDLAPHLAYGAVTVWTLHRLLDPGSSTVSR